jgi:hypothetical protein
MSSVEDVVGSCTPRLKLCNEDGTLKRGSRRERWAGLAEEALTSSNVPPRKYPKFSSPRHWALGAR